MDGSDRPESIGFTESEVHLESDRPSLYDLFNEQYGAAVKSQQIREQMIAIGPQDSEATSKATENLHAGRTFAAVRQP